MGDAEEGDLEIIPDLDAGVLVVFDDVDRVAEAGVLELVTDERGREARGVDDGDVHAAKQEGDAPNVVFVAVGNEKGLDLGAVALQVGIVRDDVIDARQVRFREADARIDQDERAVGLEAVGVLAYLSESAEGKDIDGGISHKNL